MAQVKIVEYSKLMLMLSSLAYVPFLDFIGKGIKHN